MHFDFINIITGIYTINGLLAMSGFFTTLKDVWNKIPSANAKTYAIWTWVNGFGAFYGFFKLNDWAFFGISFISFLFCIAILILRLRIKESFSKEV